MNRLDYFIRRLLLIIPTFLGITLICYSIIQFVPGGPMEQAMMRMRGLGSGEAGAGAIETAVVSDAYREQMRERFGFNDPFITRYWNWLWHQRIGLHMDSYMYSGKTTWMIIQGRLPVSLIFGLTGFLLSYLVCIPLGIAKAVRDGTTFDMSTSLIVFAGYAILPLTLGLVLRLLLCGMTDWALDLFPAIGFSSDAFDTLPPMQKVRDVAIHMVLPVTCYVAGNFAVLTMLMKNSLLDQVGQDYVRTALAKGATRHRAIWGHAVRNAMIPIATGLGGVFTLMFAGSVIIERIFEIPGMGRLSFDAIVGRDYPIFMAILAITSLLTLTGRIFADLCYILIDPRISFEK
jgi:microcin C transport system permease protein